MTTTPPGPDNPSGSGNSDGDDRFDPYRYGAPDPQQNQPGWATGGNRAGSDPASGQGQWSPGQWDQQNNQGQPGAQGQPSNQGQQWGQGQQSQPSGHGYPGAQQPGYGSSGYGAPAYPPAGYAPQQQSGRNGMAIAGMVLGIISIPLFFLTIIDIVIGVLALIFSGIGLAKSRRGRGKGMSIAGLICGAVGVIASIVFLVVAYNLAKDCLDKYDRNSSQYQQCVNDKVVGLPLTVRR